MNFYDVNIRNYNFSIRHASKNPTQDLLCSFDGTKASHFLSHRVIFLFVKVPFLRFRNIKPENLKDLPVTWTWTLPLVYIALMLQADRRNDLYNNTPFLISFIFLLFRLFMMFFYKIIKNWNWFSSFLIIGSTAVAFIVADGTKMVLIRTDISNFWLMHSIMRWSFFHHVTGFSCLHVCQT